ncbi:MULTISPECIES: hypothetical protein [unclassified Streptomyces]|uniref:hypothetical protein n=1 Tax=unclassified Streptomyces TaxID=2593676 RepID=UPI0033A2637C
MSVQQLPASTVHVMLGDCSAVDAKSVLAVLSGRFTADRESADEPHESASGRPTVWTALFDTAGESGGAGGAGGGAGPVVELSGQPTVEAQGGPRATQRLREALGAAFTVHELGTEAGDQEVQMKLRLDSSTAHETRSG